MKNIILVDRNGKEAFRLSQEITPWIFHDSRWWGFGVAKINGEVHYYDAASPKAEAPISATLTT